MDKLAVNFRTALRMVYDAGLVDEASINTVFQEMCAKLKQPAEGYFLAEDVSAYIEAR